MADAEDLPRLALRAIENLREGCQIFDHGGRYIYVNEAAARQGRRRRQDLLGKTMPEAFPGIEATALYGTLRRCLQDRAPHELETDFEHEDGSRGWFTVYFEPIPEGALVFSTDVTARKATERRLQASEALLSEAQRVAGLGSWSLEIASGELRWSDETYRIFGASPGAYRPDRTSFRELVEPTDRPALDAWEQACIRGEDPGPARFRTVGVDGRRRVIEGHGSLQRARDGSPRRLVGVVQDVTDRVRVEEALRRSEERYRTLVENLDDVVFSLDPDGIVAYVSPAASRFGYASEDLVGASFASVLHPDDRAVVEEAFRATMTGVPAQLDFRILGATGQVFVVRGASRPLLGADGLPAGVTGVIVDVTKQRETEQQLWMAQKMEAVGQLAGGVAHDFNNLLSVILSYADFVAEALHEGDPMRDDVAEIQRAASRAAGLTRQLLAFSRKQVLEPRVLSIDDVVGDLQKMLRRLIGEDVELSLALGALDARVRADPGQIEQVLMNLAVNARDAMPLGGKLVIESASVELDEGYCASHVAVKPGRYVMLSVTDTGTGMDEITRQRAFEPFFTTKEKGRGTGLGLATVYGIVQQSGGSVWIYSEVGWGTTVKVYLPRVDDASAGADLRRSSLPARGSETILVVEDEEAVRNLTVRILRSAGYQVVSAANGGEALLECERHRGELHLLLTDVIMPTMGGRELAERLRLLRPELRVLYMSGYTDNALAHHGVLERGTHLVVKPFSAADLRRRVREVLDGPR